MAQPQKIQALVKQITKHNDSVISYTFTPQKRLPRFKAGQFLHIALDEYDPSCEWPESRVFSIASSPEERNEISITISLKGGFTERMFNTLKIGDNVWLKLPFGEFVIDNKQDAPIILIAGGTGITPFISFLTQKSINSNKRNIKLYYGIRSSEHIIYDDILKKCENELENFEIKIFCEDTSLKNAIQGKLSIEKIIEENESDSIFYLSGPPLMIKDFRATLLAKGVEKENIRTDNWE